MALFITIVIRDLAKIFLFDIGRELGITSSSWGTIFLIFSFVALPLVRLLLLIITCLFRGFFGLRALFGLVGLILRALEGCAGFLGFFRLIISGIEAS